MSSSAWELCSIYRRSGLWQRMIVNVAELLDLFETAQSVAASSRCRLLLGPSWGRFCALAKDPCFVRAQRPPSDTSEKVDEQALTSAQTSGAHSSACNIEYDHQQLFAQTFVDKKDIECWKTSWLWWRHHCDQFTSSCSSWRSIPFSLLSRQERSRLGAHMCSLLLSGKPSAGCQLLISSSCDSSELSLALLH